jgi:hypothetical protein
MEIKIGNEDIDVMNLEYTMTRERAPIYAMGGINPRNFDFARGRRGITMSIDFYSDFDIQEYTAPWILTPIKIEFITDRYFTLLGCEFLDFHNIKNPLGGEYISTNWIAKHIDVSNPITSNRSAVRLLIKY